MVYCHAIAISIGLCLIISVTQGLGLSPPTNARTHNLPVTRSLSRKTFLRTSDTDTDTDDDASLYSDAPAKKPFTFGILTSGFPPQQLLVPVVKFVTFNVWKLMMNELVTHDEQGRFIRESFQAGNNPSPLELLPNENVNNDQNASPRYKLYLGNPCPWCHRVKSVMALLELDTDIPVTTLIDNAEKASKGGWILPDTAAMDTRLVNNNVADELIKGDLAGVYNYCYRDLLEEGEKYKGRCTAPLLVDVQSGKIVTNESNEIMTLLNDYARLKREKSLGGVSEVDLRPAGMEDELDNATKRWFDMVWNGAYRCGFATSQIAYDEAAADVLKGLAEMNDHLATNKYLVGDTISEVDVKNFAWVTRHDYAYTVIFKSPGGRIAQYPNIATYVKRMVADYPALLDTVDMPDACGSYFRQLFMLNFGRIIPYIPNVREWVAGL